MYTPGYPLFPNIIIPQNKIHCLCSIIISGLFSLSSCFCYNEYLLFFPLALILFALRFVLSYIIILTLLAWLSDGLLKLNLTGSDNYLVPQNSILGNSCIFAIAWLPVLIIKYPGAICWDSWMILYQYRTDSITTHHSVLYTIVFGKLIELSQLFGHPNWGLFIFAIIHYVLLALAFGYALQFIKSIHLNRLLVTALVLFWLINPYIIGFIGVIIKDIPYASCAVIIVTALMELSLRYKMFIELYPVLWSGVDLCYNLSTKRR